jgi:pyruvate,water dikinase
MTNDRTSMDILWFEELGMEDVPLVGGKNASLGEMIRQLGAKGVDVPGGFAVTAHAYRRILNEGGIEAKLREVLSDLDTHDMANLAERGQRVRELIENTPLPADLQQGIREAYRQLSERLGVENPDVAVRSSATAEDLPDASFAGQQETYLNVRGEEDLLHRVRMCFASLFTNRAISYRVDKGFDHFDVYLSVGVQEMVRSDLAASGVIFSIDTESGFQDVVYTTGSYGLGEFVVQGIVNPDQYYVFKPTLKQGKKAIIEKRLGTKDVKLVYAEGDGRELTKTVAVPPADRDKFVLNDDEILKLAEWAVIIEEHYGRPMDIEWAKDGLTGRLYIVQARPETVHALRDMNVLETYVLEEPEENRKLLVTGEAVGSKIGQGEVNVIMDAAEIEQFKPGQVLVTEMTNPDWEPIMKIAGAIVTDRGGRTCHAAIVSRELGIPCIIGSETASSVLKSGMEVTVDCSEGLGNIYEGLLKYRLDRLSLDQIPPTKTQIMMNVGIPEKAFIQGQIPCDGVGLARLEFIINSHIGIHPLALIHYAELKEQAANGDGKAKEVVALIDERVRGYEDRAQFFTDQLAQGIARIAAAFYPDDVIVRLSDFKTNEYANLIGGEFYEPDEDNPMIGWRGASRYYDENFRPAFGLECAAFEQVRDEMGLVNVKSMVPFCRTPEEGQRVIETMREMRL